MKTRLDVLLVEKGFFRSRTAAQSAIMEGRVKVDGVPQSKCGTVVRAESVIEVDVPPIAYVSRGGVKLEGALKRFQIPVDGKVCLDAGSSTGGFVDCLLQHGARKVFAVDVGYGQLAWSLRTDPRVVPMERTNLRYLTSKHIGERVDLVTLDLSFISLSKVWPAVQDLAKPRAEILSLVKPQFEAGRENVGKRGVVSDPGVHSKVLVGLIDTAHQMGFLVKGLCESPIQGPEGNIEFWLYMLNEKEVNATDWGDVVSAVVKEAHERFKK
ncbi:MAG TPA: TlyA family RNA methyltransferase [Firmicutes bacterium]|nr:TlyA family RNA methyltransferase [Bacillota bacterium]